MSILLLLLVSANSLTASWYEGPDKEQKKIIAKRVTEAGKKKVDLGKKKTVVESVRQDLYIPSCTGRSKPIPIPERRLSTAELRIPPFYTIHPGNQSPGSNLEVVDLRGIMDAQNLDVREPERRCWDRIMAYCYGARKPERPRLERQYSYYPGRDDEQLR